MIAFIGLRIVGADGSTSTSETFSFAFKRSIMMRSAESPFFPIIAVRTSASVGFCEG